jgi:hypothetical protein
MISEWILGEIEWEIVNWIQLAQEKDQWWDLVNTVTKLPVL